MITLLIEKIKYALTRAHLGPQDVCFTLWQAEALLKEIKTLEREIKRLIEQPSGAGE